MMWNSWETHEFLLNREESRRIPCPICHEPAGKTCRNLATGDELEHQPAHFRRMFEAKN